LGIFTLLMSSSLQPDNVFLKQDKETFQLQRRFSMQKDESSGIIMQRISLARRLAMKIAPHTCIRESLFAEPRIDHHFAYPAIISTRASRKLLIDVGCCMGTDVRKLTLDGYHPEVCSGENIQ